MGYMNSRNPFAEWRLAHGLTCIECAIAAGIARSSVYAVENGSTNRVHHKLLELITTSDGPEVTQRLVTEWQNWQLARRAQLTQTLTASS